MVKSIAMFLFVVAAVATTAQEAAATRYCSPLPVQVVGPYASCKCAVQNYSTVADTGVTISVYAQNGGYTTCGPTTVPCEGGNVLSCQHCAGDHVRLRGDWWRGLDLHVAFGHGSRNWRSPGDG